MSYFARTIRRHMERQIEKSGSASLTQQKLIFMIPAMPELVMLAIAEEISSYCDSRPDLELELKIAANLVSTWSEDSQKKARDMEWADERGNLTYYRNMPEISGKRLLVVLFGADSVMDSAGLADFHTCSTEMLWHDELKQSFIPWIKEKLDSSGFAEYQQDDLNAINRVIKAIEKSGAADLLKISDWLGKLNLQVVDIPSDVPQYLLTQLQSFGLPLMGRFPLHRKTRKIETAIHRAVDFFNYALFLEARQRDKALKTIVSLQEALDEGREVDIPLEDEDVRGTYDSGADMLAGLYTFISNNDLKEQELLKGCDFVVINEQILKFKEKKETQKKESIKKLNGNPVEVILEAIWITLREFNRLFNKHGDQGIESIQIESTLFKHDLDSVTGVDEFGDVAEQSEYAQRYLKRLIGGIDELFENYLELKDSCKAQVEVKSQLVKEELNCRYAKTAEPCLEFIIGIVHDDDIFEKRFGWRLPEHHNYRLSIELLRRAEVAMRELHDVYKLPVYHISYFEELMLTISEEEVRRILLHAIRDQQDISQILTNLLSANWRDIDKEFDQVLKELGQKYEYFVTIANKHGLYASMFGDKQAWSDLRQSYQKVHEVAFSLPDIDHSSLIGMLTRVFLVVRTRPVSEGDSWHADHHEQAGIATILHPSVVEMLVAQIVYLFRCFSYAVNKELMRAPFSTGFKPHIWRSYVDLSTIQSPLVGLLCDENKTLTTDVRGHELIHLIGKTSAEAMLSTRLLTNYNDGGDESEEVSDSEMFHETSESKLLTRLMLDYFDLHPHAADGLNIAVFRNKDVQPVIAAVHAYLKVLATESYKQRPNRRYVLHEGALRPYAISVTVFTESHDDSDIANWVHQWKERWEAAESDTKYELYRYCRFSLAHRIVGKDASKGLQRVTGGDFEADIAVLYDFIGAGSGVNEFERVPDFDITSRDLKFPILEKSCCSINTPADELKRKRIISNRQFTLCSEHATLLHCLKTGRQGESTVVAGSGDFAPWRSVIDSLHDKVEWIICIDPNMDERLIQASTTQSKKTREIIGFGSGVGSHGEDNYTISTEQFSFSDIAIRMRAAVTQLYAAEAEWSKEQCEAVTKGVLESASQLSGLSVIRATGVGDQHIRDFMAHSIVRKMLQHSEETLCESLISLDAYRHWFDVADSQQRPDLMWMQVGLNENGSLHLKMRLIECKTVSSWREHAFKARSQINNGLRVLSDAFLSASEVEILDKKGMDRPDRRYWWMQLHRLVASKTTVPKTQYSSVLAALERLAEGDYTLEWEAAVYTFLLNSDLEVQRVGKWQVSSPLNLTASIYAVGGGYVYNLMTDMLGEAVAWDKLENVETDELQVETEEVLDSITEDEADLEEGNDFDDDLLSSYFEGNPAAYWGDDLALVAETDNKENVVLSIEEELPTESSKPSLTEENIQIESVSTPTDISETNSGRILLGKTISKGEPVYWEFNHSDLSNRHMLIFGSSGEGKTYAIQSFLCEMRKFEQHSLVIDYTNGFLPNHLESRVDEVLAPKQHVVRKKPLPINPFLPIESEIGGINLIETANDVALRIAGLFDSVYQIGEQQHSVLHRAVMEGVEQFGNSMSLDRLLMILEAMAEDKQFKSYAQSLGNKLRPFVLNRPFAAGDAGFDWDSLFSNEVNICNIFQLAGMDQHSWRLIIEFILWDLYGHLQAKGKKTDPKVIVLDEVQNLDHREGSPLSKYLREGRKYGVSLILATQTMSQMKKDERDRMFNAEHKLFFRPAATELKAFAEIAALSTQQKVDDWIKRLASLQKTECYSIGRSLTEDGRWRPTRAQKIKITSLEEREFNA